MSVSKIVDFFIAEWRFSNVKELRKARLFVRASLLTSLFSNSYVWFSYLFEYDKGVYLMIFNVLGFLILPFFARTRASITWLGNVYVFVGAFAVIVLTHFSGGMWSAVYPWIISIPVLALLVVNRRSAIFWGVISFVAMEYYGIAAVQGTEFPVEYNVEMKTMWFVTILPGLLLIVLFISFVFEGMQRKALTEVEEKNEQLKTQKDTISAQSVRLENLIEEKDTIIRILAHDIRGPLRNISSLTDMIKVDQQGSDEYISMINQSSVNAQDLVDKVLRMDADEQDVLVRLEDIDLLEFLENAIGQLQSEANRKDLSIEFTKSMTDVKVSSDDIYLNLIFENLLSNAIKFSDRGKTVAVEVVPLDSYVQVKVRDQGPGVSEEERELLFKKFSKLSARPTAGESSTGLGLSLVKRYVELVGAKVWYEDESSWGATFVVELPLSA